jgi:uncharacterized protein YjdB
MKKISFFLIMFFTSAGLFAQQEILQEVFKVQGFPREDIAVQQQQPAEQNLPHLRATSAETFTFDDIAVWTGEGSNRAALAVQWNDFRETDAMVWGYQWDGTAYGIDMLFAVCKVDPKFHVMADATSSGYGSAIAGVGYDANGDGVFFVRNKKTGLLIYPDENGVIPHPVPTYDYDDYEAGDPEDYWGAGWYSSYWSYWLKADANASWGYSGVGASGRRLTDGCWDGWNFALGMSSRAWKPLIAAPAQGYTSGTFFLNVDKQSLNSSVSMLDKKNVFTYNLYEEANDDKHLPLNTHFAAVFGDKVYFVAGNTTNTDGSIVVASAQKLEKITQIDRVDGRSLIGVSQTQAYVGTANGIYPLDLQNNTLGSLIAGTDSQGETGSMTQSGNRVFAVLQSGGIKVIDTQTNTVSATIAGNYHALTQSFDGNVWAISDSKLVKINPQTLATEEINLPVHCKTADFRNSREAASFVADVKSRTLYWANTGANGTTVFKYQIGNSQSLEYPFFSLPSGYAFEGAGVRFNQIDGTLNISAINTTTSKKQVYVVDASNGDLLATITPAAGYSNAAFIFYPDNAPSIGNLQTDYTVALNSPAFEVPLTGTASDKDNIDKNIELSVSLANPELVTASISNDKLIITPQAGESGTGKIVLSAFSNGKQANKNISVTITRALEGIAFPYTEKEIKRGSRDTLNVVFSPANATNQALTWTRVSGTAVSVSNGIVTASNLGTATVQATSSDGSFTAECEYTVVDAPLSGIAFDKTAMTVYVNQRDTLTVNYSPADAYNKGITWTQEPTGLISTIWYSTTGLMLITGAKEGTTKLTAQSSEGGFVAECEITVDFNQATELSLNKHELQLVAPNAETLQATFAPADASNRTLTWTSSDPLVATVTTNGSVKGIAAGTAKIYAVSADNSELKDSATVTVDFIPLTDFKIAKDTLLAINKSFSATTTFTPDNASDKTVTWTTSDATVATVSSGYITGKNVGEAWIYGETNSTFKDSCKITVVTSIPVTGITFLDKEVYTKINQYKYIDYLITPAEATTKTIVFKSEDPDIAKISSASSAYAIGVSIGTVKMSVTTTDGNFSDTCLVHVVPDVTDLTLNAASKEWIVGDSFTLTAAALPENAIQTVTWASSDKSVAVVDDNGIVTALKAGIATITATSTNVTSIKATCEITVRNQQSENISLNATTKNLWLNESFQLAPTVSPTNTTNKRVMYKSSDYNVVSVGSTGRITGAGIGSATITAVTQDGGASVTCVVTVGQPDYTAGVFFVNEDWFGHQNSSLNFLTADGKWVYDVYSHENPGKELGCTSQYGTVYGGQLYIVSKQEKDPGASVQGSRLAVTDAATVKSRAEFPEIGEDADGRAFVGVDEHKGYISTSNGIWIYDIDNAQITGQLQGTASGSGLYNGQTGTMLRAGDHVFAVSQQSGLMVIDAQTDEIQTIIAAPKDGTVQRGYGSIVQSKDGNLWLSVASDVSGIGNAEDYLIKLNPYTLDTVRIALPAGYSVPNSWYAWTADGFCSSKQENKIYWKNNGGWFSSTQIYGYDIDGNQAELVYDLADYDDGGWSLYGAAFRIDPVSNAIYASLFREFGSNVYRTVKIDPATKDVVTYPMENHYWFPALPVFPDNAAPVVSSELTDLSLAETTGIYLGDKATDADNLDAAIVKSLLPGYDETLISAVVRNDSLVITPLKALKVAENTPLTVKFNSNGRVVTKEIVVTVEATTGLKSVNARISVYPNPFTDYIIVNTTTGGVATVYNLSGNAILSTNLKNGSNRIETPALPKGVYVLKFNEDTVTIIK